MDAGPAGHSNKIEYGNINSAAVKGFEARLF